MLGTRFAGSNWCQELHCCGCPDDRVCEGELKIRVEDGGGGEYLVITAIEWAVDIKDGETIERAVERIRKALS